jgi:hypothetical protein
MDRHLQVPLLSQTYIVRFKAHVRFAYLAMNMLLTQRRSGIRPFVLSDTNGPLLPLPTTSQCYGAASLRRHSCKAQHFVFAIVGWWTI